MKASNRSRLYLASAVIAALTLATLLSAGYITSVQIDQWLVNLGYAVAVIGQTVVVVAGVIARKNVTPDK